MLNDLFERHRIAAEAHKQQIDVTDDHLSAGTVTDEIWGLQFAACDAEEAVVLEICAYRPTSAEEQDRKARFLLKWTEHTEMEQEEAMALLRSMLLEDRKCLPGLQSIETLIRAYEDAIARHDELFSGDGSDDECSAALGPISDGLIAICAARPVTPDERQRRREYLSERLFVDTDGCAGLIKAVFEALLAEPVDKSNNGEK